MPSIACQGHDAMLRWLMLAADGPKLTAQLMLPDYDGKTVPELARSNGQGATADWLEALARELGLTPERSERELGFVHP